VKVAIAGGHGQIALLLTRMLAERGDTVLSLIRNPDHVEDVRAAGAEPILFDLEVEGAGELADAIGGAAAVVFAAGAGPGSSAARKLTMDRDGAVKLLEAAAAAGVPRYLIVSSVGAENPPHGEDTFSVYLRAKAQADAAVMRSDREWTVVRPGGLTNDPGTGRVRLDPEPFRGRVSREDVAAVIAALLPERRTAGRVLYVNAGEEPIADALSRLSGL
jgi:nucleoside-diphosphate-sugar epimerase